MNVRLKGNLLAAAVALAFAGSAQAALVDTELGFYASNGSSNSVFFDLGATMSQFTPAATSTPGTTITWDLVNGTVAGGTPGSTVLNYGSFWSGFSFGPSTVWGVIAPDAVAGDIMSTSPDSVSVVSNTNGAGLTVASADGFAVYYNALNGTGTHQSAANGASVNTSGNALHFNGFFAADQWRNQTPFKAGLAGSGSMPFYLLQYDLVGGDGAPAIRTNFAGTWTLNAAGGTLTYAVPNVAEIPEPSAYALVAVGLAGLGSLVRRRKNG